MAHLYMIYLLNLVIFRNYFNLPEGNILNCLKTVMVNTPLKPRLPLFLGVPKELITMGSALHQMVFSRRRLSFCLLALREFWTSQARPGHPWNWQQVFPWLGTTPPNQLFLYPTLTSKEGHVFLSKCGGCPANDPLEIWFRINTCWYSDILCYFWSTLIKKIDWNKAMLI